MTTDITLDTPDFPIPCRNPVVEWRAEWNDGDWEEAPLTCESLVWAVAPSTGEAVFRKRYTPRGRGFGAAEMTAIEKETDKLRRYIRVTVEYLPAGGGEWQSVKWYGILQMEQDIRRGVRFFESQGHTDGEQIFTAVGLEFLLDQTIIRKSYIARELDGVECSVTTRGLTFNRDGVPNCSDADDRGSKFFHRGVDAIPWSTREAVRYLLAKHPPEKADPASYWNENGSFRSAESSVAFRIADEGGTEDLSLVLPDWDAPEIDTHGRSVWQILNSLIHRQRGLGFFLRPNEEETFIELHPFGFTDENLVIDGALPGTEIPANANVIRLDVDGDRTRGEIPIVDRITERYDRIVVQGARMRVCMTCSYDDDPIPGTDDIEDGPIEAEPLQNDWSSEEEERYNAGAADADDFPEDEEVGAQQLRDKEARADEALKAVFSRMRLPEEYDFGAFEGIAGDPETTDAVVTGNPRAFLEDLRIQSTIPLREGVDYRDNKIEEEAAANEYGLAINTDHPNVPERQPFGVFYRTEGEGEDEVKRWMTLDSPAQGASLPESKGEETDLTWSARIVPLADAPGFSVEVSGGAQHMIAKDRFAPGVPSADPALYDYRTFFFTVAIDTDRYCEGVYPLESDGDDYEEATQFETVRELPIQAGEAYRADYVAPGTIVGVDGTTGELITSHGGFVNDDRKALRRIAKLAYQWFRKTRRSIVVPSGPSALAIPLGAYVQQLGRWSVENGNHLQDVNSVVTTIQARFPTTLGTTPSPPSFYIKTDYAELDAAGKGARGGLA